MFLYAKVVMDNLMAQGSLAELDQELEVKFPTGLNEAYVSIVISPVLLIYASLDY